MLTTYDLPALGTVAIAAHGPSIIHPSIRCTLVAGGDASLLLEAHVSTEFALDVPAVIISQSERPGTIEISQAPEKPAEPLEKPAEIPTKIPEKPE